MLVKKEINRTRGMAIAIYMEREGIKTRAELAKRLGISGGMVSHYFKGVRVFSGKTALRISRLTGIPMEELYR